MPSAAGDPVEAERAARAVYEEYSQEPNWMSDRAASALALCAQERYQEATRYTEVAGARPGDQVMDQIMWRIARSRAAAGPGQLDEAARVAREAATLAANTDALNLHNDALMALAETLRVAGQPDQAADAARQALDRYTRRATSSRHGPPSRSLAHELAYPRSTTSAGRPRESGLV